MIYKSLYFYNADVFLSMVSAHPETFGNNVLRIYLPYKAFTENSVKEAINKLSCEKVAVLPYINKGNSRKDFAEKFNALCETADGFMIGNIGDISFLSKFFNTDLIGLASEMNNHGKILCGDYSLNAFNAESAAVWAASGLNTITISPEPEAAEQLRLANAFCKLQSGISGKANHILPEIIADGRIIVMRSEHCFITDSPKYHCGKCGKNGNAGYTLTDNAGNVFPLIGLPLDCQNLVLSAKNIEITEEYAKKHISGDCILRYNILNDYR